MLNAIPWISASPSSPACARASLAAGNASREARDNERPREELTASHSAFTSAARWHRQPDTSNTVIGPEPSPPASSLVQDSSTPFPSAQTIPIPVTTTRSGADGAALMRMTG